MTIDPFWLGLGLFGQLLFSARFLVQWLASERAGRSVVPIAFWYFSLGGSVILLTYAIHRLDPRVYTRPDRWVFHLHSQFVFYQARTSRRMKQPAGRMPGKILPVSPVIVLVALALAVAATGSVTLPLDGHEVLVVGTTQEMQQRGDWVVPYFNGEPRLTKPPLSYWLTGVTAWLSGSLDSIQAWHARVPSILAGVGLVLLTWLTGTPPVRCRDRYNRRAAVALERRIFQLQSRRPPGYGLCVVLYGRSDLFRVRADNRLATQWRLDLPDVVVVRVGNPGQGGHSYRCACYSPACFICGSAAAAGVRAPRNCEFLRDRPWQWPSCCRGGDCCATVCPVLRWT